MTVCYNLIEYDVKTIFKDLTFYCSSYTVSSGRRISVHPFVFSDVVKSVDLGKSPKSIKISGYFSGAGHLLLTEQLESKCNENMSGWLVHPVLGALYVRAVAFSKSYNTKAVGISIFEVTFVEVELVEKEKYSIYAFFNSYIYFNSLINLTEKLFNEISIGNSLDILLNGDVLVFKNAIKEVFSKFMPYNYANRNSILNNLSREFKNTPYAISSLINNSTVMLENSGSSPDDMISACIEYIDFSAIPAHSNNKAQVIFYSSIRSASIIKLIEAYQQKGFYDIAKIEDLIDLIDIILTNECNILFHYKLYELFDFLIKIKTDAIAFLYNMIFKAQKISTFDFQVNTPAIVAAWEIYRDANKADSLRELNPYSPLSLPSVIQARVS